MSSVTLFPLLLGLHLLLVVSGLVCLGIIVLLQFLLPSLQVYCIHNLVAVLVSVGATGDSYPCACIHAH